MQPDVSRADWERFARHAALESIEYNIGVARRERRRWDGLVNRLQHLLVERQAQIERGEWPAPAGEEADRG